MTPSALARLAELRRRQGRVDEAEELLPRFESHRFHALVSGLLALDRGDAESAVDAAERFLRRVGEADRFERVAGLDLMVRATVAAGDQESARTAAEEIAAIAAACPTPPLRAEALLAQGRVAAARGELDTACPLLEDAVDLFEAAGARYDAALARLALASVLRATGRDGPAAKSEERGRDALKALGARAPNAPLGGLSAREARLVARGLSNDAIADEPSSARSYRRAPRREHLPQDRRIRAHRTGGRNRLGARARYVVGGRVGADGCADRRRGLSSQRVNPS